MDLLLLGAPLLRTVFTHLLDLASERPSSTPQKGANSTPEGSLGTHSKQLLALGTFQRKRQAFGTPFTTSRPPYISPQSQLLGL